jgi:hypothetical protein
MKQSKAQRLHEYSVLLDEMKKKGLELIEQDADVKLAEALGGQAHPILTLTAILDALSVALLAKETPVAPKQLPLPKQEKDSFADINPEELKKTTWH